MKTFKKLLIEVFGKSSGGVFIPSGNLNIDRRNMPQIAESDYKDFFEWLGQQKIFVVARKVPASGLKPIQKKISMDAVQRFIDDKHPKLDKPLLTSKDGYCLDGHHRWLAKLNIDPNSKVSVFEIQAPAKKALSVLREYPRVMFRDDNNVEYKQPDHTISQ